LHLLRRDAHRLTQEQAIPTDPPPPAPPRLLTRAATRRAWVEGRVRFWWSCAAVVLIVMTFIGVSQTLNWWRDRKLITQGVAVDAHIDEAMGSPMARVFVRDQPIRVKLSFPLADGTNQTVEGSLKPPGPAVTATKNIRIHYDPADPTRWTDRDEVIPWTREMTVVLMFLPVTALLFAIALLRRWQVLRTWRDAPALPAIVVDSRHSPMAPRSRVLRYSLRDGDRRVCHTLYPTRTGVPERGETIWLIAKPDQPQRGILAKLYEGK
jgi:hypothetical protein